MDSVEPLLELIASWGEVPWLEHAACAKLEEHDLDLFFTSAGASISRVTKQMCVGCAVRSACLSHAFEHHIGVGYFGGMSPNRRRELGRAAALAEIEAERQTRTGAQEDGLLHDGALQNGALLNGASCERVSAPAASTTRRS